LKSRCDATFGFELLKDQRERMMEFACWNLHPTGKGQGWRERNALGVLRMRPARRPKQVGLDGHLGETTFLNEAKNELRKKKSFA